MKARTLKQLHGVLLAAYFGGCILAWPGLPERIPLHFDFLGRVTARVHTSVGMWFMLPVIATALVLFLYAVSSIPEAWQLSPEDLKRFRALSADARACITESAHRTTAFVLILLTFALMGLQFGVYMTAVGGLNRMPWYAEVITLGPIVLIVVLSFRNRSRLHDQIGALCIASGAEPEVPEERRSAGRGADML